jgi:subtilisin family serine protease
VASANNQDQNRCGTQSPARMGYGGMYYDPNSSTQPLVITAGGTNINDQRYTTSSAVNPGSNFGSCVSIYAPAHMIHGAHIANAYAYRDDPAYSPDSFSLEHNASGTSFAAPVVAGVAARLLERYPKMTVRQVWDYIKSTSMPLASNFDGDGVPDNDRIIYISGSE